MNGRRVDIALFVGLGVLCTIIVGVTAQDVGFTRDEGYYFKAGELYWGWFRALGRAVVDLEPLRAFSPAVIDEHWSYNHEHPALLKTLFALGFGIRELTGIPTDTHDALRWPAWLVAGLSVSLVFALARSLLPRRTAVVAALLWFCLPRAFWHMHLSCFDIGVAAAHTWLVLAYLRWRKTWRGALAVGVLFGLAAAVKHNVLPVPALFVVHWLVIEQPWRRAVHHPRESGSTRVTGYRLPPIPLVFLSLAVVGPIVYLLHWPWLWPSPLARFGAYLAFHFGHEHYPILYFGQLLTAPPFPMHFPFVMSAVTIPVPTLALMAVGFGMALWVVLRFLLVRSGLRTGDVETTVVPLGDVAREPSASPAFLLAINAAYPFLLIALPSTPIFGGTKHWMNALPFLCVLAAWALEEAMTRLKPWRGRPAVAYLVVVLLVVLPGAVISARVWPYGLGSYNELIGFTRGAANVGMQRTFWGYEPLHALGAINEETPPRQRIHFGDTNHDSWRMYRRDRMLREDIGWSGSVRGAGVASVQPQGEFKQQWLDVWNHWDDRTPDLVLHAEGVPMLTVTQRRPGRQ